MIEHFTSMFSTIAGILPLMQKVVSNILNSIWSKLINVEQSGCTEKMKKLLILRDCSLFNYIVSPLSLVIDLTKIKTDSTALKVIFQGHSFAISHSLRLNLTRKVK